MQRTGRDGRQICFAHSVPNIDGSGQKQCNSADNPGQSRSRSFTDVYKASAGGWGGGEGWALLSNVLNGDAPPRGPTTYLSMYRYPFRITSVKNGVPFIYLLKASLLFIIFQVAINKLK